MKVILLIFLPSYHVVRERRKVNEDYVLLAFRVQSLVKFPSVRACGNLSNRDGGAPEPQLPRAQNPTQAEFFWYHVLAIATSVSVASILDRAVA